MNSKGGGLTRNRRKKEPGNNRKLYAAAKSSNGRKRSAKVCCRSPGVADEDRSGPMSAMAGLQSERDKLGVSQIDLPTPSAEDLVARLVKHRGSDPARSILEIAVTLLGFVSTWIAIWLGMKSGHWSVLILAVPGAGFLVRLFLIQHDCGHGSFFRRRLSNDWTGRLLSVLTLTPYDLWKRQHATHHANSGNLDQRGIGDITTLTVEEYRSRSPLQQLSYRLYRNPVVLFILGPAFLFLLRHRIPVGDIGNPRAWASVMATNGATALLVVATASFVGPLDFLIIHLPIVLIAASAGVWLFYVQHQYEDVAWARNNEWQVHDYALHGSSYYVLPPVLRWFTANIGMHHIHHLCAKIPFYRLPAALMADPAFERIGRVNVGQSLRSIPLTLWDEGDGRLISFAEFDGRV